jgi:hypothetical protein
MVMMVNVMGAAKPLPELRVQTDYKAWVTDVQVALASMNMDMDAWQQNWEFDFRKEYECDCEPGDAALHAHDFWWQQVLAESWT